MHKNIPKKTLFLDAHVGLLLWIEVTTASGAGSTDWARQMGSDTSVQGARCKTADSLDLGGAARSGLVTARTWSSTEKKVS